MALLAAEAGPASRREEGALERMKAQRIIVGLLTVAFAAILAYTLRTASAPVTSFEATPSPAGAAAKVGPTPSVTRTPRAIPAPMKSPLALAEPSAARRAGVTASQRARIEKVVRELNHECAAAMRRAVEDWEAAGGAARRSPPSFSDTRSPHGQVIDGLRRVAEERVLAFLSEEQRRRIASAPGAPVRVGQPGKRHALPLPVPVPAPA